MTVEEQVNGCITTSPKTMDSVSEAVEELLISAQQHDCLTVGVLESAKLMNIDPDSVLLCVLAMDEEDEDDIALQIHFTLIRAFCYENHTDILRVSGLARLEQLLLDARQQPGGGATTNANHHNQPRDIHCLLVTSSQCPREDVQQQKALLQSVGRYCEESRSRDQWVPYLALREEDPAQEDVSGKDTTDQPERHNNNHNHNNSGGGFKAHDNGKNNVVPAGLSVCLSVG